MPPAQVNASYNGSFGSSVELEASADMTPEALAELQRKREIKRVALSRTRRLLLSPRSPASYPLPPLP